MTNSKDFRTMMGTKAAALLLPLLLAISVPVQAGFIQIDFGATISNDGGITTDDITGQFRLDDSISLDIDVGGVDGIIVSGSATLFGSTETVDTASGFTFAGAAQRTGYGALSLVGDYGGGLFALDLTSDDFFPSANALEVLVPELNLANLRSFDPGALDTTQFVNLVGFADEWRGALTFLEISAVSEPGTLAIFGVGLIGLGFMRRRKI